MTKDLGIYEYAGFRYTVTEVEASFTPNKPFIVMSPVAGQHRAAQKEKHLRHAMECYLQEKSNE